MPKESLSIPNSQEPLRDRPVEINPGLIEKMEQENQIEAEFKFDIKILQEALKEIFGSTRERGWIQFEESIDPTGMQEENYRVMAFWVPEEKLGSYEKLAEAAGFKPEENVDDPDDFPGPGKFTRLTYPKNPYGIKKSDEGFMLFRVGFEKNK